MLNRGDDMTSKVSFKVVDSHLIIKFEGELDNMATYQYKTKLCEVIKLNALIVVALASF